MASELAFDRNPAFQELPPIHVGDRLVLHAEDVLKYNIKADVLNVDGDRLTVKVLAIFDREGTGEITGGDVTEIVDNEIMVSKDCVFRVLKRP